MDGTSLLSPTFGDQHLRRAVRNVDHLADPKRSKIEAVDDLS